ncbi:MAG: hypothetical protein AAGD38_24225 [Acidobacteriota bacterium]
MMLACPIPAPFSGRRQPPLAEVALYAAASAATFHRPDHIALSTALATRLGLHELDLPRQVRLITSRSARIDGTAMFTVTELYEASEYEIRLLHLNGLSRLWRPPVDASTPPTVLVHAVGPSLTVVDGIEHRHFDEPMAGRSLVEEVSVRQDPRLVLVLPHGGDGVAATVHGRLTEVGVRPSIWRLRGTASPADGTPWALSCADLGRGSFPGLDHLFVQHESYVPGRPFRLAVGVQAFEHEQPIVVIGGRVPRENKHRLCERIYGALGDRAGRVGMFIVNTLGDGADEDLTCGTFTLTDDLTGLDATDLVNRLAPAISDARGGGLLLSWSSALRADARLRQAVSDGLAQALSEILVNPVR